MKQHLAHVAIVVKNYDEAIHFYTQQLGFDLIEDTILSETKRWVLVAPPGSDGCRLLLAQAATEEQQSRVGNQTGGRVFLFLHTDDFWRDHSKYVAKGINFVRHPVSEPYGTVAVFEDLYGNLWDLIGPGTQAGTEDQTGI
jgi:catechol 2,3-dioxygenase-like lactoylglutathione lyase family enzyme